MMPTTLLTSRLYSSSGGGDGDDDWGALKKAAGNIVRKTRNKISKIIPFVKSDDEKQEQITRRDRRNEIKGGLNTALKDAPLPIRMMGRMIAPLLSRAAEQMAEQGRQANELLEEARRRITDDADVTRELGEPVQVGRPFSQSSSTMVVNGKSAARVQSVFQVAGPNGSGTATMSASDGEIASLTVNVNGRNISVGSGKKGGGGYGRPSRVGGGSNNIVEAEIIEAEIIEKK